MLFPPNMRKCLVLNRLLPAAVDDVPVVEGPGPSGSRRNSEAVKYVQVQQILHVLQCWAGMPVSLPAPRESRGHPARLSGRDHQRQASSYLIPLSIPAYYFMLLHSFIRSCFSHRCSTSTITSSGSSSGGGYGYVRQVHSLTIAAPPNTIVN